MVFVSACVGTIKCLEDFRVTSLRSRPNLSAWCLTFYSEGVCSLSIALFTVFRIYLTFERHLEVGFTNDSVCHKRYPRALGCNEDSGTLNAKHHKPNLKAFGFGDKINETEKRRTCDSEKLRLEHGEVRKTRHSTSFPVLLSYH